MDQTATRSSGFGLAEANIFARYALYSGTSDVLSLQATLSTPGIGATRNPYIAEPHASLEARITYGRSIPLPRDMSAFVALGAGYRFRAGSPADEMRVDATVGFRPLPN